jgi:hypothetical protein
LVADDDEHIVTSDDAAAVTAREPTTPRAIGNLVFRVSLPPASLGELPDVDDADTVLPLWRLSDGCRLSMSAISRL